MPPFKTPHRIRFHMHFSHGSVRNPLRTHSATTLKRPGCLRLVRNNLCLDRCTLESRNFRETHSPVKASVLTHSLPLSPSIHPSFLLHHEHTKTTGRWPLLTCLPVLAQTVPSSVVVSCSSPKSPQRKDFIRGVPKVLSDLV